MTQPTALTLAVRAYPIPAGTKDRTESRRLTRWRRPHQILVFDTETRTDTAQALTFGGYRYYEHCLCLEEGLFCGDDLPRDDRAILEAYARTRAASTDRRRGVPKLPLLSRREFVEKLYYVMCKTHGLIVGFNSTVRSVTLGDDFGPARSGRFSGGFSLALWDYEDKHGQRRIDKYRPRIVIKHIDSKRALKGLTGTPRGRCGRSDSGRLGKR